MPHVEKALSKLRREAQQQRVNKSGFHRERVEIAGRPDLFEHARSVTLDPATLESNRIRGVEVSDPDAASYKMLRARVLHRMRGNNWHKLAVTSPRANSGKTLTSINLAISLAHEPNQDVILVDLDLRKPRVGEYLGLEMKHGLTDHLTREVPIEEVLIKPDIPRLYVIPSSLQLENSSELLASSRMSAFTETLVSSSRSIIVIFDVPPLLEADDMLTFMPQVDAVLFVVAQGQTKQSDVVKSNELLKDLNVLGTVLNKSDDEAPAYY